MAWYFLVCTAALLLGAVLAMVGFIAAFEASQRNAGVDEMIDRIEELQHVSESQGLDSHPSHASMIVEELAELAIEYKSVSRFFGHK